MPRIKGKKPQQTRETILEAAIEAFANLGYERATLAAIASESGVTAATLPYHFKDKQGLWNAVVDSFYTKLFQFASTITPAEPLQDIIARVYDWVVEHRDGLRVLVRSVLESGASQENEREERINQAFSLVANLAHARFGVPVEAGRDAAITVAHLIARFVTNSPADNRSAFGIDDDAQLRERIVAILLRTARCHLGLGQ